MAKAKKKRVRKQSAKVAGKREGRDAKGRMLPGYTANPSGQPKGTIHYSAILRKLLNEKRGDKTTWEYLLRKLITLLITGSDFKHTRELRDSLRMFQDRLEGKPAQTIVADVTRREDPIDRLPSEEKRTLLKRYLDDFGVEGLD